MPDDIYKAITYVLVILPGFLCLGLFTYLSDVSFSEFQFIYLSIALTILTYGLSFFCNNIGLFLLNRFTSRDVQQVTFDKVIRLAFLMSLAVSILMTYGYKKDIFLETASKISFLNIDKDTHRRPLITTLKKLHHDKDRTIPESIDGRDHVLKNVKGIALKNENGNQKRHVAHGKPFVRV